MTELAFGLKQLIVLGNGFDLKCGLKSSYRDFFEQHFAKVFFKTVSVEQRIDMLERVSRKTFGDKRDQLREQVCKAFLEEDSDSFLKLLSELDPIKKIIMSKSLCQVAMSKYGNKFTLKSKLYKKREICFKITSRTLTISLRVHF
ncbi:hypothetical protein [Lactobacillus delbrueckii]|uniref:hypothetical protein n=1 Tax=Lactobacillus delbrueckii TaxID=1584 RepID=UPI003A8C7DD5